MEEGEQWLQDAEMVNDYEERQKVNCTYELTALWPAQAQVSQKSQHEEGSGQEITHPADEPFKTDSCQESYQFKDVAPYG